MSEMESGFDSQDTQTEELGTFDDGQAYSDEGQEVGGYEDVKGESSAESSTASEEQHDKTVGQLSDSAQEAINARIAAKHKEAKEAQERAERLEAELAKYKQQEQVKPTVLEKPDPYSDNYDAEMEAYENSLRSAAIWEHDQQLSLARQQEAQMLQQQEQIKQLQTKVESYSQRAKDAGISDQQLQVAGNTLQNIGVSHDLALQLLDDEDGPLITMHLAANVNDAIELSQMAPYQAALKIEREIRGKARGLKPKKTNTPPPAKQVRSGNNSKPSELKHARGTFE